MLSKKKKFYKVYWANGTVNIESFPIVYSNKKYVYFVESSGEELSKIKTTYIYDRPTDGQLYRLVNIGCYHRLETFCCWDIVDSDRDKIAEILGSKLMLKAQKDIDRLKYERDTYLNKIDRITKEIELLEKEVF